MRQSKRKADELRAIKLTPHVSRHAEGSCLVEFGHTKVLCAASVEESLPPFRRNTGLGWITAEYGMLPRSTNTRNAREAAKGKPSGRTQEIQRLIGRALRAVCDFQKLGERQIIIDCDVLEADGGTRTASITGGYVALHLACLQLMQDGLIKRFPLTSPVSAVSCGIIGGVPSLDLDYSEDSSAEADANFVFDEKMQLIEVQCTAESAPFPEEKFLELLGLAKKGTAELFTLQKRALAK